ncbi:GGDEF domain-containing protein [Vibrio alfacsensis]|uniref:GGDEF domain-containing protein n=1 Tax=Vibrio alfacsensis TaxID=1074311 RepID=UPI0040690DF0
MNIAKGKLMLIEKLRASFCTLPIKYGNEQIHLRASLGYAVFDPDIDTPEAMMKIADDWMYRQKRRAAGVEHQPSEIR